MVLVRLTVSLHEFIRCVYQVKLCTFIIVFNLCQIEKMNIFFSELSVREGRDESGVRCQASTVLR